MNMPQEISGSEVDQVEMENECMEIQVEEEVE